MLMIRDIFQYAFLQNAVLSAVLVSIVCGIIGVIIVEKKLVMISGGIAHTSFGGVGLGYLLRIEPIIGGLVFAVVSSLGIVYLKRKFETGADTLIGIFWSVGMALGVMFIALMPGYPPDMTSYLFGDILTVSKLDVTLMTVLDAFIVLSIVVFFNYWKAYLFDEEFAQVMGVNTAKLDYFLFVLIALTIIVLIKVVGIILVIALLTIPPAIAKQFTHNLRNLMFMAIGIGGVLSLAGLTLSYYMNVPSGATIILTASAVYFISIPFGKFKTK